MRAGNAVWIAPSATAFSCLCEACLDFAHDDASSFLEAVRAANVRGRLPTDTDVGFVRCPAGHTLVVRRMGRPHALSRPDPRQLQLT
jgi:hypothetical protein